MSSSTAGLRDNAVIGADTPRPVLIGGCPRSGTTLLGAMLGVGPTRVAVPESTFKLRLLPLLDRAGDADGGALAHQLDTDPLFRLWRIPTPTLSGTTSYEELMSTLVSERASRDGKPAAQHWVDHTPANIWRAGSLARLLPEAKFVNLVRDGRAVAASLLPLDWGPNTIAGAAAWWSAWVAHGLAAERALGSDRVLTIRFEDLVNDPEPILRRICTHVGTPFDPAMVRQRDYTVGSYTRGMHDLVAHRPDTSRVDAWRRTLTDYEVSAFERRTGDLLSLLGYRPEHGAGATLGPRHARALEAVTDLLRRASSDRLRRAFRRRRLTG